MNNLTDPYDATSSCSWIAAHCMEMGAVLATFDRHVAHIEGLRTWMGE
ncbi:MAG: hypothetical protein HKO57_09025 [Akkermansiaceae bacterium]|nr:hypothetical protein [Akkermansiaceae bacterium]